MKKILRLFILPAILGLSACSYVPGIPPIGGSASESGKPQKEGVDYRLIPIDAATIKKQKPFDYVAYVSAKKQRHVDYVARVEKANRAKLLQKRKRLGAPKANAARSKPAQLPQVSAPDYINPKYDAGGAKVRKLAFKGISAADNKANYQYRIGKGDVLTVTVWDNPTLTASSESAPRAGHVVGGDGSFYYPYSGNIQAAGKTVKQVQDELTKKLGSVITKPQLSVSVSDYRSQQIYTSGALVRPSTLAITDKPITVRDAISNSGGVRPKLYTGYATLARNGKNISIDLNRMLKHNDNRQNFILKDGDRLHVVERTELGEFNRNLALEVKQINTLSSVRLKNELRAIKTLQPIKLQYELQQQRTVARLKKELERELRSEQAKVFVMGEVRKPGTVKYQVEDGMTLAEALNDAGSFNEDTVNPKGIFVVRNDPEYGDIPTVYQLRIASVQSMFYAEAFDIHPRDIVYVTATPSIRWNRVIAQLLPSLTLLNTYRNFK